jgi:hypothetical protein
MHLHIADLRMITFVFTDDLSRISELVVAIAFTRLPPLPFFRLIPLFSATSPDAPSYSRLAIADWRLSNTGRIGLLHFITPRTRGPIVDSRRRRNDGIGEARGALTNHRRHLFS